MMVDPKELQPQGDPETVVLLPGGDALIGLQIKGVLGPTMLGIREDKEGQPISCAIGITLDAPTQSRPFRYEGEDGA